MSTNAMKAVRVFSLFLIIFFPLTSAHAGGPNIGGWKPLEKPIPAKPLAGLKMAVNDTGHAIDVNSKGAGKAATGAWHGIIDGVGTAGTVTWQAVKRPFVETWKFLCNPLAGVNRSIRTWYDNIIRDLTALAYKVIGWASAGFGLALLFAIGVAMGLTALLFRPRHKPRRRHPAHV